MTNIAEILKNATEGLKLYSMIHGGVELISAREAGAYSISVRYGYGVQCFDEYGKYFNQHGECVLFPSEDHRDWKDWQKVLMPQCVGSVFVGNNEYQYCLVTNDKIWVIDKLRKSLTGWFTFSVFNFNQELRFATAEEIEQCFKELDRQGYKFENGEVVKKEEKKWSIYDANDGDILQTFDDETLIFARISDNCAECYVSYNSKTKILSIPKRGVFYFDDFNCIMRPATQEEKYELMKKLDDEGYVWNQEELRLERKDKEFTTNDFKPFDKVLVRQCDERNWQVNLFSHIVPGCENKKVYFCLEYAWMQCIPYNEETAHLLGTTENYDGPYKTWEEEE